MTPSSKASGKTWPISFALMENLIGGVIVWPAGAPPKLERSKNSEDRAIHIDHGFVDRIGSWRYAVAWKDRAGEASHGEISGRDLVRRLIFIGGCGRIDERH